MPDLHRPLRCPLPEQLTPAHVHALLSDLRLSASQVGRRISDLSEHVDLACGDVSNLLAVTQWLLNFVAAAPSVNQTSVLGCYGAKRSGPDGLTGVQLPRHTVSVLQAGGLLEVCTVSCLGPWVKLAD